MTASALEWLIATRRGDVTAVVLRVGLAPAIARADPGEDAKAHVARATQAHKEGRYDDARVELEAAYAIAACKPARAVTSCSDPGATAAEPASGAPRL